jgi:uncharacterized membrane protein YuzA (DUF378 family)
MKELILFYNKTKCRMVLISLVLLGAINWGLFTIGYNIVEILSNNINKLLGTTIYFDKIIYFIITLSALLLMCKKTLWLPFLGKSVFPGQVLQPSKPENANKTITIKIKPNTKILYWSAEKTDNITNVWDAYNDYSNSGVTISDNLGNAKLIIREGSPYIVPSNKKISRHIHYREVLPYGLLDKVKTFYY